MVGGCCLHVLLQKCVLTGSNNKGFWKWNSGSLTKNLNVEVILISEFMNAEIMITSTFRSFLPGWQPVRISRSENTGKFLLLNLAALTNRIYCNSQHGALMNRFPVEMTPIGWREFPTIFWSDFQKPLIKTKKATKVNEDKYKLQDFKWNAYVWWCAGLMWTGFTTTVSTTLTGSLCSTTWTLFSGWYSSPSAGW